MWMIGLLGALAMEPAGAGDADGSLKSVAGSPGRMLVSRTAKASSCPSETDVDHLLSARMRSMLQRPNRRPLIVRIAFDGDGASFTARIDAHGWRVGTRTLRVDGNDCSDIEPVLLVALQVFLDDVPAWAVEAEPPDPSAGVHPESAHSADRPWTIWLGGGPAAGIGLPGGLGGMMFAQSTVESHPWKLAVSAFWSPTDRLAVGPGRLDMSAFGGRVTGCLSLTRSQQLVLSACSVGAAVQLRAQASGFTTDRDNSYLWWLVGAGSEVSWRVLPGFALGVSASLLATIHRETFGVVPFGPVYATPPVTGWGEATAQVLIW